MAQQTIINGIPHIKLSRFDWLDKETTGLVHPLGTVFLSKDKRLGFVANGYHWYMFSTKKSKTMNKIHINRLQKLADHLKHGELGHEIFDFSCYNSTSGDEYFNKNGCGTAGCAIGECPIVFKSWKFTGKYHDPTYNGHLGREAYAGLDITQQSAMDFFNIDQYDFCHLFIPNSQMVNIYGGINLYYDATKEQVAANIEAFIKFKHEEASK